MTRPAARYGRQSLPATSRRRWVLGLGLLVAVAGIGLAAVGYQRFANVDVEGKAAAFTVVDDHSVSITISVTRKDPSRPVVCIVRAKAQDGSETGRREVLVPRGESKTVQVTTTVASYKRPAVGDVYGCGTTVPGYLVAG